MTVVATGVQAHEFMQRIDFDRRGAILVYIDILLLAREGVFAALNTNESRNQVRSCLRSCLYGATVRRAVFPMTLPPKRSRVRWIAGLGAAGVMVAAGRYYAGIRHPLVGDPIRIGVGDLVPGKLRSVEWQGRTVFLLRRTPEAIIALSQQEDALTDPKSVSSQQPDACRNQYRSLRPELFVAIGQCTHQGCVPALRIGSANTIEFLCPCHTSRYDVAGRVFRGGPAPANLVIPEYRFDGDDHVVIGEA